MDIKIRRINSSEKYACSPKNIKRVFNDADVCVRFGMRRNFEFDGQDAKRAKINGIVIMCAHYNARDNLPKEFNNRSMICLYVINDTNYNKEAEEVFTNLYLPEVYQWYKSVLSRPATAVSGVEQFIVEWYNGKFIIHSYRYH